MSDPNYPNGGSEYGQQPPYSDQSFDQQPSYQPPPPYGHPRVPATPLPAYGQQPEFGRHPTVPYGPPADYGPPVASSGEQPDHYTTPYGQPLYPGPEYGPPGGQYGIAQYPAAPPTRTGSGRRLAVLLVAIVAVLAALGVGAYVLFSGDTSSSSARSRPGFPAVTIPPVVAPPNNEPPGGGPTNPCSYMSDPQAVALAYVGTAEIGQTDIAQSCVFRNSVPRSVTASLAASTGRLFAPAGSNGSTYEFASLDGHTRLAVTVTKESDGTYYVTRVVTS
jgi:hypothetical protein